MKLRFDKKSKYMPFAQIVCVVGLLAMVSDVLFIQLTVAQDVPTDFDPVIVFGEGAVGLTLYIDPTHPQASDSGAATPVQPLRTVGQAIERANTANQNGIGTRILIAAGIYRELIRIPASDMATSAPIILEAQTPGQVIFSGADLWSDWQTTGDNHVYTHIWPHEWGLTAIPRGWLDNGLNVEIPDIIRRGEMVIVNGIALKQVLSEDELIDETFFVDEPNDRVLIRTLTPPETAQIEVAVRPVLSYIEQHTNIAFLGLTFRHTNTVYDSAVQFQRITNLWLENNTFEWNSAGGLGFYRSTNVLAQGNQYLDNGGAGSVAAFNRNVVSEDESAIRNNWRGAQGGFLGWSVAGIKHLHMHGATYRRLKILDNFTHGLWMDSDNLNIVIENAEIRRNKNSGIYLEVSRGPITIRDSVISDNTYGGIRAANTADITLEHNYLHDNQFAQIFVTGENEGRTIVNWESDEPVRLAPAENWTMTENIVLSTSKDAPLIRLTLSSEPWQLFTSTLISGENVWHNTETEAAFRVGDQVVTLAQWQTMTGQDWTSTFETVVSDE